MAQTEFYLEETSDKPKLKDILQSDQNFSGAIFFVWGWGWGGEGADRQRAAEDSPGLKTLKRHRL